MQFKWRPRLPVKLPDETIKVHCIFQFNEKGIFGSSFKPDNFLRIIALYHLNL